MRKLSQINETSWGGMVRRSSGTNVRKEIENNIKEMKPIDLGDDIPVYVADIDYEEGGIDHFTWDEAMEINEKIKDTGWRLPYGSHEICDIFFKDRHLPHDLKNYLKKEKNFDELWVSFTSEKTGEKVMFEIEAKNPKYPCSGYWCDWEKNPPKSALNSDNVRKFLIGNCGFDYGTLIGTNNAEKNNLNKIRLVKDK